MKFDFIKTPTNLACAIICLVYLLPFTPYLSLSDKGGNDKISISGLQILTGSVSIDGEANKGRSEIEDVIYDGGSIPGAGALSGIKNLNLNPVLGLFDKLSFFIFASSLAILFVSYKQSIGEKSPISEENLRWVKIGLISIGSILMIRYMMIPLVIFPVNVIWTIGLGAFLTMMSMVVIYFDNKLK
jgi:hypothetical protein